MARRRDLRSSTAEAVVVLLAIGLAVVAGFAGWAVGHAGRSAAAAPTPATTGAAPVAAVDPHVAAGAHAFVDFACAQCHGPNGRGGVSPDVPALKSIGQGMAPAQLRQIIDHGIGAAGNPTKPYMPVWGEVISAHQVSDLIAYIRAGLPAVATATPVPVPAGQGAAAGSSALYVRYGCLNCHGPNGPGTV